MIGQLITLGVGTPSSIPILDLSGLSPSPAVPGGSSAIASIPMGAATSLVGNTIYSLPARAVNIDWLATAATNLDVSIDGSTWTTIATAAGAGAQTTSNVCGLFIRPSLAITVTCRRFRKI